jgi:hypothetical protein
VTKTQAQAPVRSLDQRMDALRRANDIRVRRAKLKKDLKDGRFLNTCRISQSKTVGGLSERQRAELIGLFNR